MSRTWVACASLALSAVLAFPAIKVSADEGWLVDFKAAKEKSAADGKDVLMEFTGSDWCPPCKALKANVFDKDVFKNKTPEAFILLKLDNPRDKSKQTPEEIEQYQKLSAEYKITGVPSIVLADAKGRPYAKLVGYGGQEAEQYVDELINKKQLRQKRDDLMAKAEKAEGLAKAKLLDEAVSGIDNELKVTFYQEVVDQIIKLDGDNGAGLKTKYEDVKMTAVVKDAMQGIMRSLRTANGDTGPAIKAIDDLIAEKSPKGEALQEAMFFKAQLLFASDKAKSKEVLEAAQKVAPDSEMAKQIDQILKRFFAAPAKTEGDKEEPAKK